MINQKSKWGFFYSWQWSLVKLSSCVATAVRMHFRHVAGHNSPWNQVTLCFLKPWCWSRYDDGSLFTAVQCFGGYNRFIHCQSYASLVINYLFVRSVHVDNIFEARPMNDSSIVLFSTESVKLNVFPSASWRLSWVDRASEEMTP